jgi:metal-sulfur cluster biosynthetic enzyme
MPQNYVNLPNQQTIWSLNNLNVFISRQKVRTFADIMTQEEKTLIEERIVDVLKTVYDPEIPVNIFDLGMIYKIDVKAPTPAPRRGGENSAAEASPSGDGLVGAGAYVDLDMTFTAPNCPAADFILEDVRTKVESVEGVAGCTVNLVFEPAWDQSMMSEEARVELGFD